MLIKFCGINNRQAMNAAVSLGADFCGFIFHEKSCRYVSPGHAASLPSKNLMRVGVFVNHDLGEIKQIARIARLDLLQLHGKYSVADALELGRDNVIRVLWPMAHENLEQFLAEAEKYASSCAYYLLDAGKTGGGGGQCMDWQKLANIRLPRPWFLAGGLAADNLRQAIDICKPAGVDINSGVEIEPGLKSPMKMKQAIMTIRGEI